MTDLLVGMLFVFIILLMAFALNLRNQQEQVTSAADRLTSANLERTALLKSLQKSLQDNGVVVKIDTLNGVLRLPEAVLFSRGEYQLADRGKLTLQVLATQLAALLPKYACVPAATGTRCPHDETAARLETILIEGHTDSTPAKGSRGTCLADNWSLSACRATAVFNQLTVSEGVLAAMENDHPLPNTDENEKLLGVSGYADKRPVSKEDLAENRRIDIRFIMSTPDPEKARRFKDRFGTRATAK